MVVDESPSMDSSDMEDTRRRSGSTDSRSCTKTSPVKRFKMSGEHRHRRSPSVERRSRHIHHLFSSKRIAAEINSNIVLLQGMITPTTILGSVIKPMVLWNAAVRQCVITRPPFLDCVARSTKCYKDLNGYSFN